MRTIPHQKRRLHTTSNPAADLFEWAKLDERARLTHAGRWVHRRVPVGAHLANLIAELAGLAGEPTR